MRRKETNNRTLGKHKHLGPDRRTPSQRSKQKRHKQQYKENQACPATETRKRGSPHSDRVEDGDEGKATEWWLHGHSKMGPEAGLQKFP